jgi:uncharacterized protein YdaU (DUF1376 family)
MRPTKEIVLFYFPFNYGDFSRKTAGLSEKHKLAYLQLVAQYFQQERCLDDPTKRLALKTGIKDEQEMFELLYATFEQRTDGWFDDDIEAAITKYQEGQKRQSSRGKKGAQVRWLKAVENL